MITTKFTGIFILNMIGIFMFSCLPMEHVTLHGDLTGVVTDAETSEPIQAASVKLNQSNVTTDTTSTGIDGAYLLKNIIPGDYEVQASRFDYANNTKDITINPAKTQNVNFILNPIPVPNPSDTLLYFGFDSSSLSFTISNAGKGRFSYLLTPSQDDWITINPSSGEVTNETDTFTVTVNRSGLSENSHKETIKLTTVISQGIIPDILIDVYVNVILDNRDNRYYQVVKIGTQTWMAENLNIGILTQGNHQNNGAIEKYCYSMQESNCNIYGGLYQWDEMMQYNPSDTMTWAQVMEGYNSSDTGNIGKTQGICPTGWHVPTFREYRILTNYLGGEAVAGGKLKETGTTHWSSGNTGATNETGWTGLPGGFRTSDGIFTAINDNGEWWHSTIIISPVPPHNPSFLSMELWANQVRFGYCEGICPAYRTAACSVRCVKD